MSERSINIFERSAGVIFFVTAGAKLISAIGSSRILLTSDPVFLLPFRYVFLVAALVELFVAAVCFFGKQDLIKVSLVAWLSTVFLVYRLGLLWTGYHRPCSCLGNLTDALHVSPQVADTIMKIILAYLLITSYMILLYWLAQKKGTIIHRTQN